MYDQIDIPHQTRKQRPETLWEAIGFDRRAAAYRRAGLCDSCAAYASHRHVCGWLADPRPPCDSCAPIVQTFPESTSDPSWRKWPRGRVGRAVTTSAASPGVIGCASLPTTFDRVGQW